MAARWRKGGFDYHQLHPASGEGKATMDRYGDERNFLCPDGQKRTFEWHLKGLPNAWRIHIWADSHSRKILIGYVGRHLPTINDPT